MLGSLILYLKTMRIVMFQLSGFYYTVPVASGFWGFALAKSGFQVQDFSLFFNDSTRLKLP